MTRKPHELALWAALPMAHTTHIEGRLRMILDTTRPRRALSRRALLLALTPGAAALAALAMLRPAARAQAAPAPVAASPAVPAAAPRVASPPAKSRPVFPLKPSATVVRYFISPTPPYRLMKKQGHGKPVVWSQAQPAPSVDAGPSQTRPQAAPWMPSAPATQLWPTASPRPAGPADPLPEPSAADHLPPGFTLPLGYSLWVPTGGGFAAGFLGFLGATDADKPGAAWWSNAGTPLPEPVYDTAAHRAESHAFGGDTKNVIFAFHLPPSLVGTTVAYRVSGALGSSSEGSWPSKMQGGEHQTEAQAHTETGGARVLTAAFPVSLTKTDLQIGIASGPWTKAAGQAPTRYAGSSVTTPEGTFIFSAVTPEKGNVWGVTITTSQPTQDIRVVAVDAQGHELLPSTIGDTTAGGLDQITARFADLPLPQIKEFRVEARPFQWLRFGSVALQPAK